MSSQNELGDKLYQITLQSLISKIESGEATAADMANAIRFLKDNNITQSAKKQPKLTTLAGKVLPFAKEG